MTFFGIENRTVKGLKWHSNVKAFEGNRIAGPIFR